MITIYIEFELIGAYNEHVINWVVGWLHREGYLIGFNRQYDGSGKYRIDIYVRRVCRNIKPVDMFEFTFDEFVDDMYCFLNETKWLDDVHLVVCNNEGCIDIDWNDVKKLMEEEYEEVEKRWDKITSTMYEKEP